MKLRPGPTAPLLIVLVAAASACAPAPPSTAPTVIVPPDRAVPAPLPTKQPWRVGAYLPLTGEDLAFGIDTKDGYELARGQVNERGGIKGRDVEIIYRDDASRADRTADAALALIERDGAVAVLGDVASSRSKVGGIIANKLGVPMITPASTNPSVTQVGAFVFRACYTDDAQGRAAATFLVTASQKKRIAVLFAADDLYSSLLARTFRKEVSRLGGQILIEESFLKHETDFTAHLAELRKHQPDIVYAPIYYNAVLAMAPQAKAAGMRGDLFFGGDGWESDELLAASSDLEGAAFSSPWVIDAPWPKSQAFVADFRARFRHDPTSVAALAFDTMKLLADALGRSRDDTPEGIRKAIQETTGFVGATGRLTMGPDRDPTRDMVVVQIKSGHFTYQSTLETSPPKD